LLLLFLVHAFKHSSLIVEDFDFLFY